MVYKIVQGLKQRILKVIARLFLPSALDTFQPDNFDRILIYGGMGIGNMVMYTPTLRAIRSGFPNAHIALLVAKSGCEEVVSGSDLIDKIIKCESVTWQRLKLSLYLRRQKFDVLISNFHGGQFNLMTATSGIPLRVGHSTSLSWKNPYDFLFNRKVSMEPDEHEIDRNLRLAAALDIRGLSDVPEFYINHNDEEFAKKYLYDQGVQESDILIGVQIGTWKEQDWKQWDINRLAGVCDKLMEEYGAKVIALGAAIHIKLLDELIANMLNKPIIGLGKITLKQAAAIIKRCQFSICNDSGLMHISAVMGTPVVAVYGPTDYFRTSPCRYGDQHVLVRKDLECSPCFRLEGDLKAKTCHSRICLDFITVEDVFNAARDLLGKVSDGKI